MINHLDILKENIPMIDLRSPIEFAKGAFPKSYNFPIIDNDEREKIGKTFKNQGNAAAVKLGHQLVSGTLKDARIEKWKFFIEKNPNTWMYCMRGGQRSGIAKEWLNDIGIQVSVVKGGFKALRQTSIEILDGVIHDKKRWIILGGKTGSGKTDVLNLFSSTIDLEHHANHRGSAFGGFNSVQPTPIYFENCLVIDYIRHEKHALFLEDESRTIGRLAIPNIWFQKMQESELVLIEIPFEDRIQNILNDYITTPMNNGIQRDDLLISLRSSLLKINKRLGDDLFREIRDMLDRAFLSPENYCHEDWISKLLKSYYDPLYDYQIDKKSHRCIFQSDLIGVTDYLSGLEFEK